MPWFAYVFSTDEQRKHFREYVTGLTADDEATVTAITILFLDKNDQSALNRFLTQAQWDECTLNWRTVAGGKANDGAILAGAPSGAMSAEWLQACSVEL